MRPIRPRFLMDGIGSGVSPIAYFSTRRVYSPYTGPLINVIRASDSTTRDIYYLSNGALDIYDLSRFLSGTTGTVVTWYDQSGGGYHVTQASSSLRPAIQKQTSGLWAVVQTATTNSLLQSANGNTLIDYNKPMSVAMVTTPLQTGGGNVLQGLWSAGTGVNKRINAGLHGSDEFLAVQTVAGTPSEFSGGLVPSSTNLNVVTFQYSGSQSDFGIIPYLNGRYGGTVNSPSALNAFTTHVVNVFNAAGINMNSGLGFYEFIYLSGYLTAPDRVNLELQMSQYYNVPGGNPA